jgi:hypothetical protein
MNGICTGCSLRWCCCYVVAVWSRLLVWGDDPVSDWRDGVIWCVFTTISTNMGLYIAENIVHLQTLLCC